MKQPFKALKQTLFLGLCLVLSSGCTYSLHVSHVSDFREGFDNRAQSKAIYAEAKQFVFLGFVTQTNYVDQCTASLEKQCIGGEITGISTEYWTAHSFLSWNNKVIMRAYCLRRKN